ncbi:energy transducer TonB family protein [Stakelama tenebrarum]|uniref:TonB family protein n=1 Tax=Stakelama tenebrarum TaxID=2711215 RepID=A0A6G6Y388_9SPHN|nr:energy transducer TonB [Sphingosinithalassobacter tenebrarum]QIG79073.1 TonB family protein [Sphingosinithalassobacter tenebrarum]
MIRADDAPVIRETGPGGGTAGGRYIGTRWHNRGIAILLTALLLSAILAVSIIRWYAAPPSPSDAPAPLVVELLPLAAPPDPVREVPEGPARTEQEEQEPEEPEEPQKDIPVIPRIPAPPRIEVPREFPESRQADPIPETTAPRSLAAPTAALAASNVEQSWETRLLAHLEQHRRYPAAARARREQGVVHIRFRMNRAGRILSASIARSSGSRTLDRAALATLRRSEPLPPIPEDRPEELEISVPVEFFVRR